MKRYLFFGLAMLLGLAAGLFYGWVINPVEGLGASSDGLRPDYQADYVLIVAEIYQSEQNPDLAIGRLQFLQEQNPLEAIANALEFANEGNFATADIERIDKLREDIVAWDPRLAETPQP